VIKKKDLYIAQQEKFTWNLLNLCNRVCYASITSLEAELAQKQRTQEKSIV